MVDSNGQDNRIKVASIQMESLGNRVWANLLRQSFLRSERVDLRSYWLNENRDIRTFLFSALFNRRLPVRFLSESNLDYRKYRVELTTGYIGFRRALAAIDEHTPNVLHFNTQVSAYMSSRLSRRIPIAITLDMTAYQCAQILPDQKYRFTYRPNINLDRRIFNSASIIMPMSKWAARSVEHDYGISEQKIQVIYPSVDPAKFGLAVERPLHEGKRIQLLFVGNDLARKGFYDLLPVFQENFSRSCDLHVVSNGPFSGDLPNVYFHRSVEAYSDKWFELYSRADIFVLPTTFDAYGHVFAEAMMSGLPVVGTNINAVPEIVAEGQTGFLVEPRNHRQLATALKALIDDRSLRTRMGEAGRVRAQALFDPAKNRELMEDVFCRIAAS